MIGPQVELLEQEPDAFTRFAHVARRNNPCIPEWVSGPLSQFEALVAAKWNGVEAHPNDIHHDMKGVIVVGIARRLASRKFELDAETVRNVRLDVERKRGIRFYTRDIPPIPPRYQVLKYDSDDAMLRIESMEDLLVLALVFMSSGPKPHVTSDFELKYLPYLPMIKMGTPERRSAGSLASYSYHARSAPPHKTIEGKYGPWKLLSHAQKLEMFDGGITDSEPFTQPWFEEVSGVVGTEKLAPSEAAISDIAGKLIEYARMGVDVCEPI